MSVTLAAAIEWARGRACMWRGLRNEEADRLEALADAAAGNLGADLSGLKVCRGEPVVIKREEAGMAASMDRAALEKALSETAWSPTEMGCRSVKVEPFSVIHAAARAHLATLPRTKMVERWHVEWVSASSGDSCIDVRPTADEAAEEAAHRKSQDMRCVRVTGPHQHEVPA